MIPNNNLSVLPWYRNIDEQNARRWWIYDRVYPLFSPCQNPLPFQIMRDTLKVPDEIGVALTAEWSESGYLNKNGEFIEDEQIRGSVAQFQVSGMNYIWFEHLPPSVNVYGCSVSALDSNSVVLATFTPEYDFEGYFTGYWELPAGTHHILVQIYNYNSSGGMYTCSVHEVESLSVAPVTSIELYRKDGTLVGDIITYMFPDISIKAFADYDVIVYAPGNVPAYNEKNGQYYIKLSDGTNTWYSEVFTIVRDLEPYLKITWYDQRDFVMDAGTIVYTNPSFKNVLYLDATIAKPEYAFEEEGETRDGYFFPVKLISEKRYRFKFLASEYLLDVMRFIRMADYITIEFHGQTYVPDTFLITPEWEDNGDVAAVEAVFDTATVAKKIGMGYIKQS